MPPELARVLRPVLPGLAQETIATIGREVPDYARPLEGPFGHALRIGVERALARFVDLIETSQAPEEGAGRTYVQLGRAEMRAGRSLDALQSAYRIGARLAWERFLSAAEAAGHEPSTLYALAAAIYSYIDALSAESVEGYAKEQSRTAGERQRQRRALVRLLADDHAGVAEIRDLAAQTGWTLPSRLAALVVSTSDPERLAGRLDPDALAASEGSLGVIFLADPDAPGRWARLETALAGVTAALGPSVEVSRAHHSLAHARAAHRLLTLGRLAEGQVARAEDHLLELLLYGSESTLAADLAASTLAPLRALPAGPQARLTATLRAYVDHPGQVGRMAQLLDVHPQTVRYRLGQLRELFGERLEDAQERFAFAVALRL